MKYLKLTVRLIWLPAISLAGVLPVSWIAHHYPREGLIGLLALIMVILAWWGWWTTESWDEKWPF